MSCFGTGPNQGGGKLQPLSLLEGTLKVKYLTSKRFIRKMGRVTCLGDPGRVCVFVFFLDQENLTATQAEFAWGTEP